MKKSIAQKWINALRSGEYKQGKNRLYNFPKNTYCCLGVLDSLYPNYNLSDGDNWFLMGEKAEELGLGLNGTLQESKNTLAGLNDEGYTFDEIADIIQAEYIEQIDFKPRG